MGFLKVFVLCFEFGMTCSHCASQDIMIQAWVVQHDEVVAITCGVAVIQHGEAQMSFPPLGAGDHKCILVGLLLYVLHTGICRFAIA